MSRESPEPVTLRGRWHVYQALDIGFSVDLKRSAELIQEAHSEGGFHPHARTPAGFNLRPLPVCVRRCIEPIRGRSFVTEDQVTVTIYDFGAVSVEYRVPFMGTLAELAAVSTELYGHPQFAEDARARARTLLGAIASAVKRPNVRPETEDYLVFAVPSLDEGVGDLDLFLENHGPLVAQALSSNTKELSTQQCQQELSGRIAYYRDDLSIITWNAAMVFGESMKDVRTVLELANVQLRELHYLDDQLDDSLRESYDITARVAGVKAGMRRIRELMLDGQAFSEAVTNAFKPFPDSFLAQVYALASTSMGLKHFDQSVKNKLSLLNTLYTTLADEADHERSLRLEWIVIILILIEVIMGFGERLLPWLRHG